MKSKLKTLKADVLAVTTCQANKLLFDAIADGDKVLADSDDKVPDEDQTRSDLTKALNDAVSAKVQAEPGLLKTIRGPRLLASVSSNAGSGYSDPVHRGGTVIALSPITAEAMHQAPREATRAATAVIPLGLALQDDTPGTAHWEGNDLYVDTRL